MNAQMVQRRRRVRLQHTEPYAPAGAVPPSNPNPGLTGLLPNGPEARQCVAQRVSAGEISSFKTSPGGAQESVERLLRASGAESVLVFQPSAHALGYILSGLRPVGKQASRPGLRSVGPPARSATDR